MCRTCGLISHEHVPTDGELERYYALDYRQDYHGEQTPSPHRVVRAWQGGHWLFQRLSPFVAPGSRICEVGAGIGCTVKAFQLAGFESYGIEPGHGFHHFANEQLRANVERRSLFELPAEPHFDFLLLVHVIEHLNSPRKALIHLRSLLRPGGRLYVECPNIAAPHAAPGRQFHFAHIYNFSPTTLVMLAQSTGFAVQARLSDDGPINLRFVLEKSNVPADIDYQRGYPQAIQSWESQRWWKYYLRPTYWRQKLRRDLRFAGHHLGSRWQLERILQSCQSAGR
jgi:2-polyprenyl-3-methyl-5-hydroxy-6-metoxy-1,4-benzoquinol methylase